MYISLSILLLLCLIFLLIGAVVMLLLQYYVYIKISNVPEESSEQRDVHAKYSLPMAIQETARAIKSGAVPAVAALSAAQFVIPTHIANDVDKSPLVALNFIMQFLFHELKSSNRVRKWFYRKLSLELDELLAKTTTGKLFDKLTIKELELGDQFPELKALHVNNVELDDNEGRIESLDLLLDLHYMGNFRTTIDADMVLGKKGSLTLKVKQLSGLARLQFTRIPYTHWSLSFLGDPKLDLGVDSKYQGRQMQSNITSLISNQIRKAVRRKHTLPNYKLRYKPFFHKSPEEEFSEADGVQPNGTLEVKLSELSRLMCPANITDIYCTLTLASLAFVHARQRDDRNVIVSLNVEIRKAKNQQIGIVFKQASEQCVEIETVMPNTPACKSNLKVGDILIAIEGKCVNSIQQVAKLIKSMQTSIFTLRIERIIPGIIRNDAILEDLELYEDLGDLRTSYGNTLRNMDADLAVKQVTSRAIDRNTSSESSLSNTPTSSPKKTKLIAKALKKTISRENSEHDDIRSRLKLFQRTDDKQRSLSRPPSVIFPNDKSVNEVEHFQQHSTIDCILTRQIHMEDLSMFKLNVNSKFLNICVYGKSPGDSMLLGFVNIPIVQLLAESLETSLNQHWKSFELSPPMPQDLSTHALFNQSGFEPELCFGDILCAFVWDGNPNLADTALPKQLTRTKSKSYNQGDKNDDSIASDSISIKSDISSISSTRLHNFLRTHFQRATQCDFCGKKIWLKDAVQCRDCSMCCHKKCVNKCQNSTVCGPVDCNSINTPTVSAAPEFTLTEPSTTLDTSEGEEVFVTEEEAKTPTTNSLEVGRTSLSGLLAEGIKRVNSANNLAIPGIVSTLTGGGTANSAKSLPPSPQHTSRKSSLVNLDINPLEIAVQLLEELPADITSMQLEQIDAITEPIIQASSEVDAMSLAKNVIKPLYSASTSSERVDKINLLLAKLRLIMDNEIEMHSPLANNVKASTPTTSDTLTKSEERMQALSVIMLYLCTSLQAAQNMASQ